MTELPDDFVERVDKARAWLKELRIESYSRSHADWRTKEYETAVAKVLNLTHGDYIVNTEEVIDGLTLAVDTLMEEVVAWRKAARTLADSPLFVLARGLSEGGQT